MNKSSKAFLGSLICCLIVFTPTFYLFFTMLGAENLSLIFVAFIFAALVGIGLGVVMVIDLWGKSD